MEDNSPADAVYRYVLLLLLVYPISGAAQFPFVEDATTRLSVSVDRSTGAFWGDYDADNDLDLIVVNINQSATDALFRNEGNGVFTELAIETNGQTHADTYTGVWADLDNDGDLDFVTSSLHGGSVYLNEGSTDGVPNFAYRPSAVNAYSQARDVAVADYDGDGFLDAVLARRFGQENILIRNGGDAPLAEGVPLAFQDDSAVACWSDLDNNGWPDLYIVNNFDPNRFYTNHEGQLFAPALSGGPLADEGVSAGCSFGDYDGDGDLDVFVTNSHGGVNRLIRNDAAGPTLVLNGPGNEPPADSRGSAWGDVDNDGDLDLVVTRTDERNTLYLNDGTGTFSALPFGNASDGLPAAVTLVDHDADGDLDLFITYGGYDRSERNRLYRNAFDGAANWLQIELNHASGRNRFGVGAHVYAYVTVGGVPRVLLRAVETRSGRMAQNGNRLHFGLGAAAVVDSVVVVWPQGVDEERTVLYDVPGNQIIRVSEQGETTVAQEEGAESPAVFGLEAVYPNPSAGAVTLAWRALEAGEVDVEVFDVLGRRVGQLRRTVAGGQVAELRWEGTTPGRYLVRIRGDGRTESASVVIVR